MKPSHSDDGPELTVRGTILGAAITVVFMAANVYIGLKTGVTFSSSIPAAIISMSALKLLAPGGILENNIVQTQASAAGTLCNVILVIPGLLLIGFWHDFPIWQTMALCLLGGLFGVAYSVPLRRVMVVESHLPFPEGIAAAEVLIAGHKKGDAEGGLRDLAISAGASGLFNLVSNGFKLVPEQLVGAVSYGHAVFRFGGGTSLALIGVGYLVRLGACLALLLGVLIAWGIAVPILTSLAPHAAGDPAQAAAAIWSEKVRLIGAGIIAVGGLWTVVTLIKPMIFSIASAVRGSHHANADKPRKDRDVPITWVGVAIAGLCVPSAALFAWFTTGTHLTGSPFTLVLVITLLTAICGFLIASACGYMAGLLGSSSSPISGFGILSTMLVAAAFASFFPNATDGDAGRFIVALTLFITSMIVTTASIANDNLQDLKTGHMIGATPWKQQVALGIGVIVGAITIAPVLGLLYHAYGFTGALPRPDMNPQDAMPAPQATLITQIANGIVHHQLAWNMVLIGAALGAGLVALEAWFRRSKGFSLPALTVGIGVYLPATVVVTIAAGGVIGWLAERALARKAKQGAAEWEEIEAKVRRRGVLIASGFLVGESLIGIFIAAADGLSGKSGSLAWSLGQTNVSATFGLIAFTGILAVFFRTTARI